MNQKRKMRTRPVEKSGGSDRVTIHMTHDEPAEGGRQDIEEALEHMSEQTPESGRALSKKGRM